MNNIVLTGSKSIERLIKIKLYWKNMTHCFQSMTEFLGKNKDIKEVDKIRNKFINTFRISLRPKKSQNLSKMNKCKVNIQIYDCCCHCYYFCYYTLKILLNVVEQAAARKKQLPSPKKCE